MRQDQGQARWQAIWRDRGWQARLLWPLSRLYGLLSSLRRSLYAHGLLTIHQLPVPVVVVGNVVVGGAGKTPTVLALLHHLKPGAGNPVWCPGDTAAAAPACWRLPPTPRRRTVATSRP